MKIVPDDAIIMFFDGFSKYAYFIYTATTGGYSMSNEKAVKTWIINSKKFFQYLKTRYDLVYDEYEMMAISEDFGHNKKIEELLEYFIRISKTLSDPNAECVTHGDNIDLYWNVSNESILTFFMGFSFILNGNFKNRDDNLMKMYGVVNQYLNLGFTKERIMDIDNFIFNDEKIDEIKHVAFDIFKIKHIITGNLKHMDASLL